MYTEEYEQRGFPFRDFLLKLILILIFVFLLIWLLPKFITPTLTCDKNKCNDLSPLTSQIFADNLEKMKEAAISYYTNERLPQEVGDSYTLTLGDMIGLKLITPLIDKNNKACDVEKSYVKITKMDEEYLLKVNLKCSDEEDYILVHLGCYNYCDSYICEKKYSNISIKESKPQAIVSIKKTATKDPSQTTDKNEPTSSPSDNPKPTDEPIQTPSEEPGYIYEYKRTTNAKFSAWTSWSSWSKTSCATNEINCNDLDITCLKKLQRFDRKEKIGTYDKKYVKTRQVLTQTGSYQEKTCSKYNYVIVNNITYATTTTTTYETINKITSTTNANSGSWIYQGTATYTNPPKDTATTIYKFIGYDFSRCLDTCQSLPVSKYAKYTLSGGASKVTNTTSTPNGSTTSSSTSTSTNTTVSASCGSYTTKTIPIYGYITVSEIGTRKEPLYGTVCYQSTKTRTLEAKGTSKTKWSKYNDTELLEDGWYYTGNKKKA